MEPRRRIAALSGHVAAAPRTASGASSATAVEGRRPPSGPYSPGVVAGGFLYIASSAGSDADGGATGAKAGACSTDADANSCMSRDPSPSVSNLSPAQGALSCGHAWQESKL